jgi:mRNA-degrading endonuclease HigB of HigAB toxin-antitoxin module
MPTMQITGALRVNKFMEAHPDSRSSLNLWVKIVREATWERAEHISKTFRRAESVDGAWIFPLEGGNWRVAAVVWFPAADPMGEWVRVLQIMDGADVFDAQAWKMTDEHFQRRSKRKRPPLPRGERLAAEDDMLDARYARVTTDRDSESRLYGCSLDFEKVEDWEYPFPTAATKPGDRLQFLMRENELSNFDVAAVLGGSAADVDAIVHGDRAVKGEEAAALAAYFSVNPTLFGSMNTY